MHPVAQLRRAFAALPSAEYRRVLYRTVRLKHIKTPLSGIGATITGARFTSVGGPETLYFAEEPLTAFVEYHHQNLTLMRDLDDPFIARLAVVATIVPQVVLDFDKILDLTRREVRQVLGTDLNELSAPWTAHLGSGQPPTQVLGQEAYSSGLFQAIRYPSARNPGGVCVAVFADRLTAGGAAFIDLDDSRNGGPKQRIP